MTENIRMKPVSDIEMDRTNLYREEVITDLRVGSIQVFTPVKVDGTPDPSRTPMFSGEAQIMGPSGPLPIRAKIDAATLEEAISRFPVAVDAAIKDMVEQVRELQRQEMSRIVTPDEMASSLLGGGGPRSGRPSKVLLK